MKPASPKLSTARLCGAPRRGGKGPCCRPASAGKLRCRLHGADSTGPTTEAGMVKAVSAMVAGRAAWVAKMNALKSAGVIDRLPGGRPPRGSSQPRPGGDKLVRQARLILDNAMQQQPPDIQPQAVTHALVPAPVPVVAAVPKVKPWEAQGHGEKLNTLTGAALNTLRDILDQPTALDDPKMLSLQKDTALSILGAQIKVEAGRMQQDRTADLNRLLQCIRAGEIPTFLDAPCNA